MTDQELLDSLGRASTAVGDLVDRIAGDQWAAPTPCSDWTVRDVLQHLVGLNLVFTAMFEGAPIPERGQDRLGDDPAGAYHRSTEALQAAATRPGVLEESRTTAVGVATGRDRIEWRIADLLTHGWDLARATGLEPHLPDDLVAHALTFVEAQLPGQSRAGRFGEPQPVPADASTLDRLAAFTGRPVAWTP